MPKAPLSPRRLSRARQPPAQPANSTTSSTSSQTRQERSTQSHNKASSPHKSATPQSVSSEGGAMARANAPEGHTLRRSKRTMDLDDEGDVKVDDAMTTNDNIEDDEEIVEDEETTRCICGYQEYPGPPLDPSLRNSKSRDSHPPADEVGEGDGDGGLFIQCDKCKVWQHGGCVSLMEERMVPDNYYCEECRPEHHEVLRAVNGQKFSHYLPVWSKQHPKSSQRKSSVEKEDKSKSKDKDRQSRASALPESKRRSTMNSRAAFDEDEVLRKVLEASKADGQASVESGSRKGKRNRDDSDDIRSGIKRQRTASSVLSSHSGDDSAQNTDIEDAPVRSNGTKKPLPKQAQQPKIKAENSKPEEPIKRRGGRRTNNNGGNLLGKDVDKESTIDEEDESTAAPTSARPSRKASPVLDDAPDTPRLGNATTSKRGGKKGGPGRGRSNPAPTPSEREEKDSPRDDNDATPVPTVTLNGSSKRGKRGQHARDNGVEAESDHNNSNGTTAQQSDAEPSNHDIHNGHHHHNNASNGNGISHNIGKKKEPSMAELKRRAAAMLDWVEKAKDDLGRNSLVSLSMSPSSGSMSPGGPGVGMGMMMGAGIGMLGGPVGGGAVKVELGSVADMLQTRLLGWQVEYGGS